MKKKGKKTVAATTEESQKCLKHKFKRAIK